MNHLSKIKNKDKRFLRQLVMVSLFIIFPVIMIFFNGTYALKGILWRGIENQTETLEKLDTNIVKKLKPIKFGIYDPENHFSSDSIFRIKQIYLSWVDYNQKDLLSTILFLKKKNIRPLLTIEPWPFPERNGSLLIDILNGIYDGKLHELSVLLNKFDDKIYISWGHEMDQDLSNRYPWSVAEPKKYISSYRYVVNYLNKAVKNEISWIWASVVKNGSTQYWPGDAYVDLIGMPIYSFPDWDKKYHGYIRDFSTTFNEKYNIIKSFQIPIIITEMGVVGSHDFQEFWLRDAFLKMQEIPDLYSVVFFYSKDTPGVWGKQVETPDWRGNVEILRSLVIWFQENR